MKTVSRTLVLLLAVFSIGRGSDAQDCSCHNDCVSGTIVSGDGSTVPADAFAWVAFRGTASLPDGYGQTQGGSGPYLGPPLGSVSTQQGIGFFGDYSYLAPGTTVSFSWDVSVFCIGRVISGQYYPCQYPYIVAATPWKPAGQCQLVVGAQGCESYQCSPTAFDFKVIGSAGTVSGRVTFGDGTPAPAGMKVTAYDPLQSPQPQKVVTTDANGNYDFTYMANPVYVQNNWGLFVIGSSENPQTESPVNRTYTLVAGPDILPIDSPNARQVVITSSQRSILDLELPILSPFDPSIRSCPAVGEPVSVATGNVFLDQADADIPGLPGLRLVRSYNSKNAARSGMFGPGWTSSYESRLTASRTNATFHDHDGVPHFFADPDGDGTHEASVPFHHDSWIVAMGNTHTRHFRQGGHEDYDSQGHLVDLVDASGNATSLTYDVAGHLVGVLDSSGRSLTLDYANDRVTSLTGPDGLIANYGYDAQGRLESVTYPDGSGYTFTYDGANQLLTVSDLTGRVLETHTYVGDKGLTSEIANGVERYGFYYAANSTGVFDGLWNWTAYEWGVFGGMKRITRIVGPCSSCGGGGHETQEWTYDTKGRVTSHTDGNGAVTTYEYDPTTGDLIKETDPLGQTTTFTYDAAGRIITKAGPDGATTTYTHGPAGPLSIIDPITRKTTLTYTASGKPETITDPRTKTTTLVYNTLGDLLSVTDPLGNKTSFSYDPMGRRTTATDPLSHTTTTEYDPRGRVTKVTTPDGKSTAFAYDAGGRRTTVTDALGRKTEYGYDAFGRIETVKDPMNGVTTYGYDQMSHLISLTDARGKETDFEYDGYGRVILTADPAGGFETFTYNPAGRLETKTDRRGIVTTLEYDPLGRLTRRSYSDGTPAATYSYDAVGRLLTAANGADSLTWTYDLAGQLLNETSAKNASTVAYGYDAGGNRLSLSLDGSLLLTYAYDDAGRLTQIRRGSSVFSFDYDRASQRRTLRYPNGVVTRYGYDAASRLRVLTAGLGRSWDVTNLRYGYDGVGNRTAKVTPGVTTAYGYDLLSRLTDVTTNQTVAEAYGYDAVGNRLTSLTDPNWRYDDRNELVSNTAAGFTYDANGNLTSKTEDGDRWLYEWNAENQLVRVVRNVRQVTRFAYDPLGRRVGKVANVTRTRYAYDGEDILRERTGATTRTYLHGPGIDEPLAVEDASGSVQYFHADALGSIVAMTDSRGQVTARYEYDSFGVPQQPLPGGHSYTAREWDPDVQMYFYRARWYAPREGRLISEDLIPAAARSIRELNAYAYVANNPANYTDPLGLSIFETCPQRIKREVDAEYCSKNAPKQAGNDPSCREAHCIANCRISRECFGGPVTAAAASKWKEFTDTWDPTSGTGWDPGDQAANRKGRLCGTSPYAKGWDCEELCKGTR